MKYIKFSEPGYTVIFILITKNEAKHSKFMKDFVLTLVPKGYVLSTFDSYSDVRPDACFVHQRYRFVNIRELDEKLDYSSLIAKATDEFASNIFSDHNDKWISCDFTHIKSKKTVQKVTRIVVEKDYLRGDLRSEIYTALPY